MTGMTGNHRDHGDVGTMWGGDHGDNMETTAMGVWGPCGDDVGMMGTMWR